MASRKNGIGHSPYMAAIVNILCISDVGRQQYPHRVIVQNAPDQNRPSRSWPTEIIRHNVSVTRIACEIQRTTLIGWSARRRPERMSFPRRYQPNKHQAILHHTVEKRRQRKIARKSATSRRPYQKQIVVDEICTPNTIVCERAVVIHV